MTEVQVKGDFAWQPGSRFSYTWALRQHHLASETQDDHSDSAAHLHSQSTRELSHVDINYNSWRLICKEMVKMCYLNSDY